MNTTQTILTAAHCVEDARDVIVTAADHDRVHNDWSEIEMDVERKDIRIHPHYNDYTFDHDIAILKLPEALPIDWERDWNVDYACIPEIGQVIPAGTRCWVAGWGTKSEGGDAPFDMREVNVDMYSDEQCLQKLGAEFFYGSSMVCAGDPRG